MDFNRLSSASKILLVAGVLGFINLFLPWNRLCLDIGIPGIPGDCFSVNGWHGLGVLNGLLIIALLAIEAAIAGGARVELPLGKISAAVAGGIVLFTILKVIIDNEFLSFGAWIGLVLAAAIGYGGWMRYQEVPAGPSTPPPMSPPPPPPPPPAGP
jgi:hypothetical protein